MMALRVPTAATWFFLRVFAPPRLRVLSGPRRPPPQESADTWENGPVAITKADLVDEDWLELVQEDIRAALQGTFLQEAPMIPVSSVTGAGLKELQAALDAIAGQVHGRSPIGPWRLPIDRVFTI